MTGCAYSHPRCYARALANCSTKISKEHYITHAVLKRLNAGPNPIIWGMNSVDPSVTKSAVNQSFKRRILCEHHNNGASNLDKVGLDAFDTMASINEEVSTDAPGTD